MSFDPLKRPRCRVIEIKEGVSSEIQNFVSMKDRAKMKIIYP